MTVTKLDLELTGRCPLACLHCYAESGPTGAHGTMTLTDWLSVLEQGAALRVTHVQLIGGEPTTHPAFAQILTAALDYGLNVEVFTNLIHVRDWGLYERPGVTLATSYYSDRAEQHDRVTGRPGSHQRTRANIAEALRRSIPLRASVIDVGDGQRTHQARRDLLDLGVGFVRIDRARSVGRGSALRGSAPDLSQLCGRCGNGKAAINPNGDLWPCVMSRWMVAGNVLQNTLADIIGGPKWRDLVATIPAPRSVRACNPDQDGNDCGPAENEVCGPAYDDK